MDLQQPSYWCDALLDIMDDCYCLVTRFRFETKDIANEFVNKVPFVCTPIHYETVRCIMGYNQDNPYRLRYSSLEDALADAKLFSTFGDSYQYIYASNVFREPLETLERLCEQRRLDDLEKRVAFLENLCKKNNISIDV